MTKMAIRNGMNHEDSASGVPLKFHSSGSARVYFGAAYFPTKKWKDLFWKIMDLWESCALHWFENRSISALYYINEIVPKDALTTTLYSTILEQFNQLVSVAYTAKPFEVRHWMT